MKQCNKCGTLNPDNARFCAKCANNIQNAAPGVVVPITQPQVKHKKSGRIAGIIVVIVLFLLAGVIGFVISLPSDNSKNTQPKSILAEELNLTDEQENNMLEIFEACGIGEIISAKTFQSGDTSTSYHLEDTETAAYSGVNNTIVLWVDNESKTVEEIHFHGYDIYMNGEVVSKVTDHYVNSEDRSNYRVTSEMTIKKLLNYPDTAKFPSKNGWKFGVEEGVVIVQSTVTAQNAFGVESTSDFQIKFEKRNIISLILDGTEYIN